MKNKLISLLTAAVFLLSFSQALADKENGTEADAQPADAAETVTQPSDADTAPADEVPDVPPAETPEPEPEPEPIPEPEPTPAVPANTFTDVDPSHWAYGAITALADAQVINGMGDGTFNPSGVVTREQFVKLIVGAYQYGGETDAVLVPPDVNPSSWSYSYIRSAIVRGIVDTSQLQDGHFDPSSPVTRAVAVGWLANSLNKTPEKDCPFPDIYDAATKRSAAVAAEQGLIGGYEDGTFKPDRTLTRAEAAVIISRLTGVTPPVPYPQFSGTYCDMTFSICDTRNSWPIDNANITAQRTDAHAYSALTDSRGSAHLYLPAGDYMITVTHGDYDTYSFSRSVSQSGNIDPIKLTPISKSSFKNVYLLMSDNERSTFINAINSENVWYALPNEYNYKTGYAQALGKLIGAASSIPCIDSSLTGGSNSGTAVSARSSAQKTDSYMLRNFALSPNHSVTLPELSLSYADGYWIYKQLPSNSSSQSAVPEALYTADNSFYYLKYSMGVSPDTSYALLYKTKLGTYQIVWASKSPMRDADLTNYINEAKTLFPSCAANNSASGTVTITVTDPRNGYAIDNVSVIIYSADFTNVGEGVTDQNGNIISTLPNGTYNIYMEHQDYAPTYSCFTVNGDAPAKVTIDLK